MYIELTGSVGLFDDLDLVIGHGAHHLDEHVFIGPDPGEGIMQFLRVELRQGSHQSDQQVFELAAGLAFQVRY